MRFASIPASQLAAYGRMDAGFHLALQSVKPRVEQLESRAMVPGYTPADLMGRLDKLPLYAKECLKPLLRGQGTINTASANRAIEEYPFIAYALVERHLPAARTKANQAIIQATDELRSLDLT